MSLAGVAGQSYANGNPSMVISAGAGDAMGKAVETALPGPAGGLAGALTSDAGEDALDARINSANNAC